MKNIIAMLATLLLANTLFAQCENGVCQVPAKSAVLKVLAAPIVFAAEHQPVRRTVSVAVNMVATVPQAVRRVKPVRSLAAIPVRVFQRQPVRSAVRRLFCR